MMMDNDYMKMCINVLLATLSRWGGIKDELVPIL